MTNLQILEAKVAGLEAVLVGTQQDYANQAARIAALEAALAAGDPETQAAVDAIAARVGTVVGLLEILDATVPPIPPPGTPGS